jgi:hypothetical protein
VATNFQFLKILAPLG